jgi:hypothetical protein
VVSATRARRLTLLNAMEKAAPLFGRIAHPDAEGPSTALVRAVGGDSPATREHVFQDDVMYTRHTLEYAHPQASSWLAWSNAAGSIPGVLESRSSE